MPIFESTVYILCVLTSLGAMWLLLRSYRQNGSRLLLWSATAFVAFALNNMLLFADFVLPDIDLRPERTLTTFIGVAVLLYAFIWEID
ncbi:MAG TPA: DUF5985 family protein [Stellaceae bacterium]|nr:DUF5985 family protein [Stellaceae bacterium]